MNDPEPNSNDPEQVLPDPTPLVWDERLMPRDRDAIEDSNAAALRLSDNRVIEINVSGPFRRSKLAWKMAVYSQGLHHRVVNLADGIALSWNHRNTLAAFLSARALIETLAVIVKLEETASSLLASEDLERLNDYLDNGTFATRDSELLAQSPQMSATNILTYIARLDKILPGVRSHYDRLSERCHPNSMGHVGLYSKLDRQLHTVSFRTERHPQANAQAILVAYLLIPLGEARLDSIRKLTLDVSDLQHRLHPVVADDE